MSTENDVARSLRSWLREDRHEDADRVLDLVFDLVPTTPQRRAGWLARRFPFVNSTTIRYGIAAAVVVAAAILGFSFLARPSDDVGPTSPSPSTTQTAAPSAESSIPLLSDQGTINDGGSSLAAGTYLLDYPFPAPLALTVPAGWLVWHVDFLSAGLLVDTGSGPGSGYGLFFLSPGNNLYADPCDKTQGMLEPVPGPTVDDLATVLGGLPGMTASTPVDIEVDGYAGKLIELTAPADAASCPEGGATLWDFAGLDDYPMALGERLPIRIIDIDGVRVVIVATDYPGTSAWELGEGITFDPDDHAEDQIELQAIFESIQINP
jgi:hypothetical protein